MTGSDTYLNIIPTTSNCDFIEEESKVIFKGNEFYGKYNNGIQYLNIDITFSKLVKKSTLDFSNNVFKDVIFGYGVLQLKAPVENSEI